MQRNALKDLLDTDDGVITDVQRTHDILAFDTETKQHVFAIFKDGKSKSDYMHLGGFARLSGPVQGTSIFLARVHMCCRSDIMLLQSTYPYN